MVRSGRPLRAASTGIKETAAQIALALVGFALTSAPAEAGKIYLRDGRVLEARSWWESGDLLFYERQCGRLGIPRDRVGKIEGTPEERRYPGRCPAPPPLPGPASAEGSAVETPAPPVYVPIIIREPSAPPVEAQMPAADCPRYWSLPRFVRRVLAGSQLQQICDPAGGGARSQALVYVTKVESELIYGAASWSRYVWRVEIRNATSEPLRVNGVIEFLDSDGTVISQQPQYGLTVRAGAYQAFTGRAWIPQPEAARVSRVTASVWLPE